MGRGATGSTADFGSVDPGSSPGGPAYTLLTAFLIVNDDPPSSNEYVSRITIGKYRAFSCRYCVSEMCRWCI